MTCIHGAEHVVSLFLGDVFHLPQLKMLVSFYNRLRNFFGSVRHSPAAMFRKQSKAHNGGAAIGFIKIAETRMGGCSIGLLRLIRLRDALVATSLSPEFKKLNVWRDFCSLLQDDDLWELIFAVSRALYPAMRVLRLADCKVAGMEKLYYYVRMADKMMAKYVPDIESLYGKVATEDFLQILSHEGVAVGELVDDSDEDEFDNDDSDDEVSVADDVDNEVDDTFSVSSDTRRRRWRAATRLPYLVKLLSYGRNAVESLSILTLVLAGYYLPTLPS